MTGTAFPGHAPITITVSCLATGETVETGFAPSCDIAAVSCLATGETVETHPLTIGTGTAKDPAWTIATGHDLPAERIAAALGGERVPCLDIVDFEVPAIQRYYEALRHDPLVRIEPRPGGRWGLEHTVTGCGCASDTWALPEQAVAHYRNLEHWSATQRAPLQPTRQLLLLIQGATGAAPWSERWPLEIPSPAVGGHDDLWTLWESGLHPDLVHSIHARLRLSEPLEVGAYLQITSQRIDMDWLGQFSDSAMAVAWAARTYTRHDRSHPCDRVALYQAGLNFHLIADLLGSPYNADDLRSLAEALKVSVNAAGHVLAGWLAADCAPQVDDLIRAARLADGARPTPAAQAIQAIASAAG
ncbi:MAG: hypothetical protein HZY73_12315 [Micropruina sp.]|nr:MAG: hypothetical protein HZY73_12315 [Micropruina sp.]